MTASLPRFALRTAIVLGAVCTLGMWPIYRWESTQGLVAWAVAFAVVLVGSTLGAVPLATRFARQSPENFPQAWLIGFGLRMLFILSACLTTWISRPFPPNSFLLGAGVGYAVVLAIEIGTASRMMRDLGPVAPAAGAAPLPPRSPVGETAPAGELAR